MFNAVNRLAVLITGAGMGMGISLSIAAVIPGAIIILPGASFVGFIAPSVVIRRRRNARCRQLQRELRLVEHKQLQQREAGRARTNAVTPVRFTPEQH